MNTLENLCKYRAVSDEKKTTNKGKSYTNKAADLHPRRGARQQVNIKLTYIHDTHVYSRRVCSQQSSQFSGQKKTLLIKALKVLTHDIHILHVAYLKTMRIPSAHRIHPCNVHQETHEKCSLRSCIDANTRSYWKVCEERVREGNMKELVVEESQGQHTTLHRSKDGVVEPVCKVIF